MRAFVTGASGQLGSFLVRELLENGHEVAVLLRPGSSPWRLRDLHGSVGVLRGELESLRELREPLSAWKPNVCFHLAWFGVTAEFRNDPRQVSVNARGTLDLLDALAGSGCETFVGVGSQAEYGIVDGALSEDLPTNPVTAYGATKHAVRILSEKFCEFAGIRHVWLRLLATYGPADDERHLIPFVLRKLLAGEKPSLTPAEQSWDYLYVTDAARALRLAGESQGTRGVMNLGCGEARPVRWIVEVLRDRIDPLLPLGIGEQPYRPDQVMFLQADTRRIQEALGWTPQVSWEVGLALTADWYAKNPDAGRANG